MGGRGDGELAKAVTTYLLNTTELRPQPSVHAVWAIVNSAVVVSSQPHHNPNAESLAISTGSVAELYIEPLARCFGDYDTMYHFSDMIAVPEGHPPPRRLPVEFSDSVNVYEFGESHGYPGYVYLVLRYQLSRCGDDTYSWSMYEDDDLFRTFLLNVDNVKNLAHGPARVNAISNIVTVISGHIQRSRIPTLCRSITCFQFVAWCGRHKLHAGPVVPAHMAVPMPTPWTWWWQTAATWFRCHIGSAATTNGRAAVSTDCRFRRRNSS